MYFCDYLSHHALIPFDSLPRQCDTLLSDIRLRFHDLFSQDAEHLELQFRVMCPLGNCRHASASRVSKNGVSVDDALKKMAAHMSDSSNHQQAGYWGNTPLALTHLRRLYPWGVKHPFVYEDACGTWYQLPGDAEWLWDGTAYPDSWKMRQGGAKLWWEDANIYEMNWEDVLALASTKRQRLSEPGVAGRLEKRPQSPPRAGRRMPTTPTEALTKAVSPKPARKPMKSVSKVAGSPPKTPAAASSGGPAQFLQGAVQAASNPVAPPPVRQHRLRSTAPKTLEDWRRACIEEREWSKELSKELGEAISIFIFVYLRILIELRTHLAQTLREPGTNRRSTHWRPISSGHTCHAPCLSISILNAGWGWFPV